MLYWLDALASRGYVVLDHWIDKKERNNFFDELLLPKYLENRQHVYEMLEMLADRLWDRTEIRHNSKYALAGMLEDIEQILIKNGPMLTPLDSNYVRVKKVRNLFTDF